MILTFVNGGTSHQDGIDYLFSEKDANGKERNPPPELLEGDILLTKYLIQNNPRQKKYSSYALSFRDNEEVTDEQLKEILQSLRDNFFPGMGPDRVNMLAVKHTDKNNIEVHLIITDEIGGKQFNPFPPGERSKKLQRDFCAHWNHKLGFEQIVENPFKSAFSRFDAKVPNDRKEEFLEKVRNKEGATNKERKEKLGKIMGDAAMSGKIVNRDDLINLLEKNKCKITRKGKDYISVVLPGKEKAIRFRGECFSEDVDYRVLVARHNSSSKHLKPYQVSKLEKDLEKRMEDKRDYLERVYAPKKRRIPKIKSAKTVNPQQIKNNKKPKKELQSKPSIQPVSKSSSNSFKNKNNHDNFKSVGISGVSSSLEQIGSLETKILALSLQLSHVPASLRTEIERQIYEIKAQLALLQQQLEEKKKAELNNDNKNKFKI